MVGGWIRAEGGCEGGGNYLKYFKRSWNRKEGKRNQDFKIREQAGARGGKNALKKGGWNPLRNYGKVVELFFESSPIHHKINQRFFKSSNHFLKSNSKLPQLYIMLMVW